MGHSSKKKKRGGTGRRRAPSNDHTSIDGVGGELLSEELTAVRAIFQEDCDIVSESPPRIKIKLRPYSQDSGYEDLDVSALLSIRFLPGYPYKCPKLLIIPEKGLSKSDADNLLSLLHDQANLNAREGRVMIYNLVEAAQEFLSEVVPLEQPHVPCVNTDRPSKGPFVYGFIDLFMGSGESWPWGLSVDDSNNKATSLQLDEIEDQVNGSREKVKVKVKVNQDLETRVVEDGDVDKVISPKSKLDDLEEESKSIDSYTSEELVDNVSIGEDYHLEENTEEETDYGEMKSDDSESMSSASMNHHQISHTVERDLILAHLLRLACAPKAPLADALTDVTSELVNLGTEWRI